MKYSRRAFLKEVVVGSVLLASGRGVAGSGSPSDAGKLNFLFILMDDMGWRDLGCYGSSFYETPNIDRLAREGVRFTNAYAACPVCSPTRASIMTGKYPARLGLTQWLNPPLKKAKLIEASWITQMPLEEFTIAEALKEANFTTCICGKWHLGEKPYYPENQGFDFNFGGSKAGSTRTYFSPYHLENLEDGPIGECLNDRLVDESAKFVEAHKDSPFFLYLANYAVHTPLETKKALEAKYAAKATALPPPSGPRFIPEGEREARQVQDHAVYAGMVQDADDNVGRILAELEKTGLADRTVVIFMSDNGGLSTSEGSPTSNVPLRGGKGWLYEGGIREPMIIKWPGVTKPGTVCDAPVISTDFYPTILEMAGLPPRPEQHKDGLSLVPLLKGAGSLSRQALYWHYPHYSNQGGKPSGAIRSGKFKLIEFFEDDHVELYDLENDLGEKKDLAKELPEKAKELREMLHSWRVEVKAKMPVANPEWKENR